MPTYDVIVAGTGAMGSAALYRMAARGLSVLGIDRYRPPHALGSSWGESRLIREAYFEAPYYVPLLRHAYDLWHQLQANSERRLIDETGGVYIGTPGSELVAGATAAADEHGVSISQISRTELAERFPVFKMADDMMCVYDPRSGVVFPENCISEMIDVALRSGATTRFDEQIISWKANGDGVTVTTDKDTYHAAQLVLSTGPWLDDDLASADIPVTISRQLLFWFESGPAVIPDHRYPIFALAHRPEAIFYGFPPLNGHVKAAIHREGTPCKADTLDRTILPDDVDELRELLDRFLPGYAGAQVDACVCMYANTHDNHFLIDHHPHHNNVVMLSPCSGHGFKFAPAIGDVAADLVENGKSRFDLSDFSVEKRRTR